MAVDPLPRQIPRCWELFKPRGTWPRLHFALQRTVAALALVHKGPHSVLEHDTTMSSPCKLQVTSAFILGAFLSAAVLLGTGSSFETRQVSLALLTSGGTAGSTSGTARTQELQRQLDQVQRQLATLLQNTTHLQLEKQQLEQTSTKLQQQATNASAVCQRVMLDREQLLAQHQLAEATIASQNSSSSSNIEIQEERHRCEEEKGRAAQLLKDAAEQLRKSREDLAGCEDDLRTDAEADRRQLDAVLSTWPQILAVRHGVIAQQPQRGIITSAAQGSHVANAFVNLYVLRHHLHCSLPVAITFYGAIESVAAATRAFFKEHIQDITFYDTSRPPYPAHQRPLLRKQAVTFVEGWKLKVYGLYQAPFQEVLYLDSDCMPLYDPRALFETPEYQQHGVVIFPDRPGEAPRDPQHQLYTHFGLHNPWAGSPTLSQADTGMLLLNRTKHVDVLEYLLFLNVHDDFTYRVSFGDKDTFGAAFDLAGKRDAFYQSPHRLSLALTERQQNPGHFAWSGYVQMAPNGSAAFIHRSWFTKYNPGDDTLRSFTHMTVGLSPQRAKTNEYFSYDFPPSEIIPVPAEQCHFDPLDLPGSEQRCGFHSSDTGLPIPAFALPQEGPMVRALKAADEAFLLLRGAVQRKGDILG